MKEEFFNSYLFPNYLPMEISFPLKDSGFYLVIDEDIVGLDKREIILCFENQYE